MTGSMLRLQRQAVYPRYTAWIRDTSLVYRGDSNGPANVSPRNTSCNPTHTLECTMSGTTLSSENETPSRPSNTREPRQPPK